MFIITLSPGLAVAARENVTRFGKSQGYDVAVEDTEDGWKLTLTKA